MRQFTCPKSVAHPSTNWARCRATALIETNALPLHQTATSVVSFEHIVQLSINYVKHLSRVQLNGVQQHLKKHIIDHDADNLAMSAGVWPWASNAPGSAPHTSSNSICDDWLACVAICSAPLPFSYIKWKIPHCLHSTPQYDTCLMAIFQDNLTR